MVSWITWQARGERPLGCVIGDISMVRTVGRSGIPVALVAARPGREAARSRYCVEVVPVPSWVDDGPGAVAALVAWARRQPLAPIVFYQGDHDLLDARSSSASGSPAS